ncbi:MAG: hypothetical protein AB1715_07260, partial [Acidobacteriota bacterium]
MKTRVRAVRPGKGSHEFERFRRVQAISSFVSAAFAIGSLLVLFIPVPAIAIAEPHNLAREARASASESYQSLTPEKANDG